VAAAIRMNPLSKISRILRDFHAHPALGRFTIRIILPPTHQSAGESSTQRKGIQHAAGVGNKNEMTKSYFRIICLMKKTTISVTEAARNFADCVNRAHYQNVSFILVKNGKPVARLTPENEKVCTGRELAAAIGKVRLSGPEARAWYKDISAARRKLFVSTSKWEPL
jgi:prevent-host-death family protein